MNPRSITLPLVLALTLASSTGAAFAYPGQQYAARAQISIQQARAIALKALPGGRIVDQELEKEKGGSGLRYSFDVTLHGMTHEIGVDAKTGNVLENAVEGANPD